MYVSIISFFVLYYICLISPGCREKRINEIDFGDSRVEGDIYVNSSDTTYNGAVKYYDENGKLRSTANFRNNILEGDYVSFYPNGKTEKKASYTAGKENEFSLSYDSLGRLVSKAYYYYGRELGSNYFYTNERLFSYRFFSFDGWELYKCQYLMDNRDTLLEFGSLVNYITRSKTVDGEDYIEVFLYLIDPPHKEISYILEQVSLESGDTSLVYKVHSPESSEQFKVLYLPYAPSKYKYIIKCRAFYPIENITIDVIDKQDMDLEMPLPFESR